MAAIPATSTFPTPPATPPQLSSAPILPVGQTLEGTSLGQNRDGQTLVQVNRQVLTLDLPEKPPAGAALNIRVQADASGKPVVTAEVIEGEPIALPPQTRAALQALLSANAGKILTGLVTRQTPQGATTLLLGGQTTALDLPVALAPGTQVRLLVASNGGSLRLLPQASGASPATLPLPVAVAPDSAQALAQLNLQSGRRFLAQVLARLPGGETQIALLGKKFTVMLPQNLEPGTAFELDVTTENGAAKLTLAPRTDSAAPRTPTNGPLQALLAAVEKAAFADQGSLAPALATIGKLLAKADALPANVARAAQALAASQLEVEAEVGGEELRQALLRSGTFSEAQPGARGDIKAALLQLRSALIAWLGPEALSVPANRRAPPPGRGGVPRSQRLDASPADMPVSGRDLARTLLGEANSALHRLRLMQLASLPDASPSGGGDKAGQVLAEIPMRLGQEVCMAQFMVGRDAEGGQGGGSARRGWQMRFSVNFSAIGEVGAQIGLFGQRVSIGIWAEREATARALEATLPEVTQALAAKGIQTVSVQCRHGIPKANNPPPAGRHVDAVR